MRTSAPGKLMLLGEHAVVYGHPCIVTAIDKRLVVYPGQPSGDTRFLDAAVAAWGKPGQQFKAESEFSGAFGFGSSSAVTVATLKALRPDVDNKTLFDTAYKIVLDVQGKASGFDVAAAIYGGTLYYVGGGKIIEPLSIPSLPLVIGYTGVKADTTALVGAVAQKREKYKQKVDRIFGAIAKLVEEAKTRMLEGDWERVGRLMDFNQEYLRDLGVSSEKLESLISAAKKAGAWGAKLSGAGGGDCMIALHPGGAQGKLAVAEAIRKAGGEVVDVTAHTPGVRVETTDDQDELFIVVDADDNILGYKTRYECHHNPTLIHRTVGVLLFNDKGHLLLQKRSVTKDMEAGLWGISAAGHVTKGQTDEEAVHRELQEELGVDAALTFYKTFITKSINETERTVLYQGKSNGPFRPNRNEVSEVRFFDPQEIKSLAGSNKLMLTTAAEQSLKEVGIL